MKACLSISGFRFQVSNLLSIRIAPSWICLRDFDISSVDLNVDRGQAYAVNYLIDFHFACRGVRGQRDIIEVVCDLSMRSAGKEPEGCIAWQKHPSVSLSDVYLCREFCLGPPIVRERKRATLHCKIQVCETVARENSTVTQPCVYFPSLHTV